MAKTRKFKCQYGKKLKGLTDNARHDKNNIMKVSLNDPRVNDLPFIVEAWGYDEDNRKRKEIENVPMSNEDCRITCSNMKTIEVMDFIHKHCGLTTDCKCWEQICDDVYDTHGHGRPNEEGTKAIIEMFRK